MSVPRPVRSVPVRSGAAPRHRLRAPATTAATAASTSASVRVRSSSPQRQPVGEALARRRRAAGRGRCRTGARRAAAGRRGAGSPPRPSAAGRSRGDDDREVALDRREARRRGDPVLGAAGRRPGPRSRARRRRPARRAGRASATTPGWSSPTIAVEAAAGRRRAPPGRGGSIGLVGSARVRRAPAGRAGRASSSMRPFASSRSYGARRPVPGRRLGRAGQRERRAATTRAVAVAGARRSPCRSRRSRRRRGPGAGWSTTTSSRLPTRLWRRTECWLESGLVTRDRAAAGLLLGSPSGGAVVARSGNRSTVPRRDEGVASRPRSGRRRRASRGRRRGRSSGSGRYGGIGVSGRRRPGRARSRGRGRPPRRRRPRSRGRAARSGRSPSIDLGRRRRRRRAARAGGDRDRVAPAARRRSRSRPGPGARAARRRARSVPSRRLTRAGRNATRGGGGLDRGRVDRARRDLAAGPLGDEPGRPVGADPRQAELLALLEAQARLGAERVAERRPADADRVEDGRLDDDVGRRVADLATSAPPMTPGDPDRARAGRR